MRWTSAARPGRPTREAALLAAALAVGGLVVALLGAGGAPQPAPTGLPDAGPVTGWGLPVTRLAGHVTAAGTVGALLTSLLLGPGAPAARRHLLRAGGRWAAAAALVGLAHATLLLSDLSGLPLRRLDGPAVSLLVRSAPLQGVVVAALLSALVAWGAPRARGGTGAAGAFGLALVAVLPGVLLGHAAQAGGHLSRDALAVHVLGVALWVGGLLAALLHLGRRPDQLAVVLPRFSPVALGCCLAVAGSGLLVAWPRLSGPAGLADGWTRLLALKAVLLAALVLLGAAHRRVSLPRLRAGRPRALLRLAAGEVMVMAVTLGVATALSRTPPPVASAGHGVGSLPAPAPADPVALLLDVQVDPVPLVLLGTVLSLYGAGVRSLRRAGRPWPGARSAAASGAGTCLVLALASGLGRYAPVSLSVQVVQLLVLVLLVPPLVVRAAPLTLAEQFGVQAPRALRRVGSDPLAGAVACAALLLLFRTPLVEPAMRHRWAHLLLLVAAVAAGLLLAAPRRRPPRERAAALLTVAACLAVLAWQLRTSGDLLAGQWFREVSRGVNDPVADQRRAAVPAALAALGLAAGAARLLLLRRRG